ncbi:MAG: transporter [Firmicutes bacterium]|nr:transporter [Bacillota bacterium]
MVALETLLPVFFMLALGFVSRVKGWITSEQKAGANRIVFNILFPILVFSLMSTASIEFSTIYIVGYVFIMFLLSVVVGKVFSKFIDERFQHISPYLMSTCEGGNVALPLYLSIVGQSSNTVIFDIAGTIICFVVFPVLVARASASSSSPAELIKKIFSNSFVLATLFGLVMNVTGIYSMIDVSSFGPTYNAIIAQATTPIVSIILFLIGFDLKLDKDTLGPIVRFLSVRFGFYALVIVGFFILFPSLMADKIYLMAVLIYFMCPAGFGLAPILSPLIKNDTDSSFMSAVMSLGMIVTLIVYTCVVLFIA